MATKIITMKNYTRSKTANAELPAFVYVLEDPRIPGEIRYIGCTQGPQSRSVQHLSGAQQGREGQVYEWIRYLRSEGVAPRLRVLWQGHLSQMYDMEVKAIACYRKLGFPLLNVTAGGNGCSIEYRPRPKTSIALRGRRNLAKWVAEHGPANKGVPMSAEQKVKLSKARMGWKRGLVTEETRAKLRGTWTPERREMMSKLHKGSKISEERRLAIVQRLKGVYPKQLKTVNEARKEAADARKK